MNENQIQEFNKAVGRRIRSARTKWLLTEEQLADRVGITQKQLRLHEAGKRSPTIPELERISACLRLPIGHFVGNCVACGEPTTG